MDTQADSARLALRRSLDSPPAGSQEAFPTPSPVEPPRSFTLLMGHLAWCPDCPPHPCKTGIVLARTWLATEETRERIAWL